MNTKEKDILNQAYIYLQNELNKAIEWIECETHQEGFDAVFQLNGKNIYVDVKNEIRPYQVEKFKIKKSTTDNFLLVTNYITPFVKKLLKENNINYVDGKGNILLKILPTYIHIEGIPNEPINRNNRNRAFTKAGIKVVFQFLTDNALINAPYRKIAQKADVGLGTIPKVVAGLKNEGFLLRKTEKKWIINNKENLINRWQLEYNYRLKPALFLKRYRATDKNFHANWKKLNLINGDAWGGEPAGDILTNYLQPEKFTLYTNQIQKNIMQNYRWIPDDKGDIYVYEKFWNYPIEKERLALLTYADLMETKNSRCIEIATLIYEQYL